MSAINRELEAALVSGAPNLTPEQVAQLRTTVAEDTQLLDRLNADAASGHLRGFALAAPGARNLLGAYDSASGTVTLPADSFGTGSVNLLATLRVQHMSMEFAHTNPAVMQVESKLKLVRVNMAVPRTLFNFFMKFFATTLLTSALGGCSLIWQPIARAHYGEPVTRVVVPFPLEKAGTIVKMDFIVNKNQTNLYNISLQFDFKDPEERKRSWNLAGDGCKISNDKKLMPGNGAVPKIRVSVFQKGDGKIRMVKEEVTEKPCITAYPSTYLESYLLHLDLAPGNYVITAVTLEDAPAYAGVRTSLSVDTQHLK
jgi:hypothetical protein